MNRGEVGPLSYEMIAKYGLNDMHCILIEASWYEGPWHRLLLRQSGSVWYQDG